MNCSDFLSRLDGPVEDPTMLAHLRSCSECVDAAIRVDADNLFRALGGDELVPPGGEDLFVASVMQQVAVRQAERTSTREPRYSALYRWSIAAVLAVVLVSGGLQYRVRQSQSVTQLAAITPAAAPAALLERPLLEDYDSAGATIVEIPAGTSDMKIVMVFDDSLPTDL